MPKTQQSPKASPKRVEKVEKPKAAKKKVEVEKPAEDAQYEVEKVLNTRYDSKTRQLYLLIKWKGFSEEENTWEPLTNMLHCDERIHQYISNLKKD
jgi:hypothetical protein